MAYIWHHELREWIEGGVGAFYVFTFGIGPALFGYCFGRWIPVYVRAIPLLFMLPAGIWWVQYADHGFNIYIIGNVLYTAFLILGLMQRAKDRKVTFWSLHHFDWIIMAIATLLISMVYQHPAA
jgi:hypothetical protein